jgi:predicted RNA-binding Zn ribbon-like protein
MARYDLPNAAPDPVRLVQRFVNTVDKDHGREWLATPHDLVDWFEEAGLGRVRVTWHDLERAHDLRSALQGFLAANNGAKVDEEAIGTINGAARAAPVTAGLDERRQLHFEVEGRGVDAALGRIVAVAFRALTDGTWSRLKTCRNCSWAFYDYSRNRSGKWCSMQICGNRLKSRTYRRRTSGARSGL